MAESSVEISERSPPLHAAVFGTCSNTWIVENRSVKCDFKIFAAARPAFCSQTYGNDVQWKRVEVKHEESTRLFHSLLCTVSTFLLLRATCKQCVTGADITKNWSMFRSRESSVGIVTAWTAGVQFPEGPRYFCLLSTASRPALGPTQPPIHWVTGALSPGVKATGAWS
jgi:hypothetical protein